jgi:polysaccharide transporter, PST family
MYTIQACNYLIPLVALPFLSHALGPERFGQVGFAQAFLQFFVMVTDFGFDLTATRKISISRQDPTAVARVYWTVTTAKSVLALACGLLIAGMLVAIPALHNDRGTISLGVLWLSGTVLNPLWLYQGMERMPVMAFVSLMARIGCLIPVFFVVHSSDDYLLAAFFLSSPLLVSGIVLTTIAHRSGMVSQWYRVTRRDIWVQGMEAFHVFSGSALTFVYTYANAVILKFVAGNEAVGFYVTADKLVSPIKQLFAPLIQTIYPRICLLYAENNAARAEHIIKRVVACMLLINLCAIAVVFLFGDRLLVLFFGAQFLPALPVLKTLIFLPMIIGLAVVLMQLRLIAQGELRSLKRIYGIGAVFHVLQSFWLVVHYGATGTAVSVVLTEILVTLLVYLECRSFRNRREFAAAS